MNDVARIREAEGYLMQFDRQHGSAQLSAAAGRYVEQVEQAVRHCTCSGRVQTQLHHALGEIARGIHDELMGRRPERRASLLVDSEHPEVRALYESWGYRKAGQMQPFDDSHRYDAMVLDLH